MEPIYDEALNKASIALCENVIKSYKDMLSDVFKNQKDYLCDSDELEWYKNHLRVEKNLAEVRLKQIVQEQIFFKNGLNPLFCYKY